MFDNGNDKKFKLIYVLFVIYKHPVSFFLTSLNNIFNTLLIGALMWLLVIINELAIIVSRGVTQLGDKYEDNYPIITSSPPPESTNKVLAAIFIFGSSTWDETCPEYKDNTGYT